MPTLLIWHGYAFRFYASDAPEPPHVHVVKNGRSAKVWLRSMELAYRHGYSAKETAEFLDKIAEHRADWMEKWDDFFGI